MEKYKKKWLREEMQIKKRKELLWKRRGNEGVEGKKYVISRDGRN